MSFGIIGSGSWGTALAKILTDKGEAIHWWFRNQESIDYFNKRFHNPHYLPAAKFDISKTKLSSNLEDVITKAEFLVIAVPSAYVIGTLSSLPKNIFNGKKIISAIKGILPDENVLLNDYLMKTFDIPLEHYFAVLGPC
ncbi:MAG: glycerol-3-phosphate dehydrogenase, partial [Ferruginibacter sp.]|nr:glycerol-3-phosphate dehydrogenase [Ferruginibacter sp.]